MTQDIINHVEQNSLQVKQIVETMINNSTKELDDFIESVKHLFLQDKDIPDGDLDKILLKIPTYLYYLTTVLQDLDIRKGVAAESAKFNLNDALISSTGTVAEKQAKAENETIKNRLVQLAYKSATQTIQAKMNGAMEILSSAKRVQQRRLEEMKLTKMAGSSVSF